MQMLSCESRQLDQHVCSSFPKPIESRRNSTFSHYSHSDIYGPSPISSFGFKYFFIDEFFSMHLGAFYEELSKLLIYPLFSFRLLQVACLPYGRVQII